MIVLILDASAALAAVLPEPNSADAQGFLTRVIDDGAVVPTLWCLEVDNTLLVAERRRSIAVGDHKALLRRLAALPIVADLETSVRAWRETIELAQRRRLTLYDAAYLELSLRRGLPLATFEAALRRAANTANVALL
jgi:predicted nucleic acid-binding protein